MGTFIFILFLVYSVWICSMIVKRKNTNDKGGTFRTCVKIVIVNGLFFLAAIVFWKNAVTIVTGETCQATVMGISEQQSTSSYGSSRRTSRSHSTTVYAPILYFQTKNEGFIERTPSVYTDKKPVIGDKMEIRYSSFTQSVFANSLSEYAFLCLAIPAFIVLFLLEWIFLSYALRGTIPVMLEPFFRKFRKNLFIFFLIAMTWGMSFMLCIVAVQSIFFGMNTRLPLFVIVMCCLFAILTGAIGFGLVRHLMKKKTIKKGRNKLAPPNRRKK